MATELSQIKDPSDVVALVVDNGLFVEIAIKLAQTYKKVYYLSLIHI